MLALDYSRYIFPSDNCPFSRFPRRNIDHRSQFEWDELIALAWSSISPPKKQHGTPKLVACRCFSFYKGLFSGSKCLFSGVYHLVKQSSSTPINSHFMDDPYLPHPLHLCGLVFWLTLSHHGGAFFWWNIRNPEKEHVEARNLIVCRWCSFCSFNQKHSFEDHQENRKNLSYHPNYSREKLL